MQRAMAERNAEVAPDKRIEFRVGTHVGDVVEESDGDLMGDGVNIPARLQAVATPGGICISDDGVVTLPWGEREAWRLRNFQTAATAVRHVSIAAARST